MGYGVKAFRLRPPAGAAWGEAGDDAEADPDSDSLEEDDGDDDVEEEVHDARGELLVDRVHPHPGAQRLAG
jgi:hypothetical protein